MMGVDAVGMIRTLRLCVLSVTGYSRVERFSWPNIVVPYCVKLTHSSKLSQANRKSQEPLKQANNYSNNDCCSDDSDSNDENEK